MLRRGEKSSGIRAGGDCSQVGSDDFETDLIWLNGFLLRRPSPYHTISFDTDVYRGEKSFNQQKCARPSRFESCLQTAPECTRDEKNHMSRRFTINLSIIKHGNLLFMIVKNDSGAVGFMSRWLVGYFA